MRGYEMETLSGGAVAHVQGECISFGPALSLSGARMHYERNAEIFGEGEPAQYVYRVLSGTVRAIRITSDGRRQILAFHLPGEIFGLELGANHSFSVEAVTDCELVLVRRSIVDRAAAENPAAAHAVVKLLASELSDARAHALVLGRKGASERVAAFLLQLAERGASNELNLSMSRADIADYLGLTIETVSRAFTAMERDHAIDLPSSRRVVVRNRAALAELEAA
ncbi:MAG TPA: helix-turn-helix domain-containing protein [Caulobacterales bacterium]|nr:helix-turn-helix domain-containing protein [Caulobacterales bacterium]